MTLLECVQLHIAEKPEKYVCVRYSRSIARVACACMCACVSGCLCLKITHWRKPVECGMIHQRVHVRLYGWSADEAGHCNDIHHLHHMPYFICITCRTWALYSSAGSWRATAARCSKSGLSVQQDRAKALTMLPTDCGVKSLWERPCEKREEGRQH